MITPAIVQVVFWLGILGCVLSGLLLMSEKFVVGLAVLVGGPVAVRMYCELIMLGFRNYDGIKEISSNTRR